MPGTAILIVEDEALIRHDLSDFFEDAGLVVHDAETADEAIALMHADPAIRIVLTDIQMPGSMDGMKLAHHIRDRYPPTLLVVVSGAVTPGAQDLPAEAIFMPKPIDPQTVLRAIAAVAGRHEG